MRRILGAGLALVSISFSLSLVAACGAPQAKTATGTSATATQATSATWDPAAWDVTKLCGTKPIKVGIADGLQDTWRKIALAEVKAQAAKCPNITQVLYTTANGNPQQALTDINSLVAQGVNVLIVLPDFGDAELPALRAATKAGVTVIPYYGPLDGTAGVDYATNVILNNYQVGVQMADWFGANVKTGNVAVVGGVATSPSDKQLFSGVQAGLKKYPALHLIGDSYLVGNYDPQTAEKVVSGALSRYGSISSMATDGCWSAYLKAFDDAGTKAPALACVSGGNQFYCDYAKLRSAGTAFPLATWEKTTQVIHAALRRGLADYNGIQWAEPTAVAVPKVVDTFAGTSPPGCSSSLPADADVFSGLSPAQLVAALK